MKQLQSYINAQSFSPWDHDQDGPQSTGPISNRIFREFNWPEMKKKNRMNIKFEQIKNGQINNSKTLIGINSQGKNTKVEQLKQYINRKKSYQEHLYSEENQAIKFPIIRQRFSNPQADQKNFLQNYKYKLQDENEQIFKKYGDHRKNNQTKVQRSLSYGSGVSRNRQQLEDFRKKYETLNVNTHAPDFKITKLEGKRYSHESRSLGKVKNEINYLPSKPNITPHHILFGHNSEDVLKRVLKQIYQKGK